MSPVSGRLFDKFGPRVLAIPGLLITTLFTLPLVMMNENTSASVAGFADAATTIDMTVINTAVPKEPATWRKVSLLWLSFVYTVRCVGLALVNMPLNTWGLNALENRVMAHGTAIGNTFLTSWALQRLQIFYFLG